METGSASQGKGNIRTNIQNLYRRAGLEQNLTPV